MRTFWNTKNGLRAMDEWQPNSWVQVTCPTQEDTRFLVDTFGVPDYYISDIADTDERARYDIDEGWILIILRIPYVKETKSRTPYTTIPLGIIMKGDVLITVCNFETNMMIDFVTYQQKRGLGFTDSVDMIFRLFLCSAVWYLKRLKQISTLIDKAKQHLDHNVSNADLIALSRLQDSLTYFVTSIRGNENLLSKLKFKLPIDELDADMIEDVNIEMSQARETTNIYANILDSTMDIRQHHQQQHERSDEDAHQHQHHTHVPHTDSQPAGYERNQRNGECMVGISACARRFGGCHCALHVVFQA